MKSLALIATSVLVIASCSSEPKVVHLKTVKGQREQAPTVHSNSILTMEIEGMTCEMGCGGSIRKELKATGGVERVKYDFEEGRTTQTATILFDNTKVTKGEMIQIVNTMNEKQFKVGKTNEELISKEKETSDVTTNEETSDQSSIEIENDNFGLPNLFEILTSIG